MTDNEIIKALECCSTYKGKCTDCPAFVKVDRSNCKQVLLGAIEIINRQKADLIDKEKQLQDALKSMAVNKTKVIDCEREIDCQKSEIERLNKTLVFEINSAFERGKAEAYKEFAEKAIDRVEKARQKYRRLCKEQGEEMDETMNIHFNGIVNLLKELVGEDDD